MPGPLRTLSFVLLTGGAVFTPPLGAQQPPEPARLARARELAALDQALGELSAGRAERAEQLLQSLLARAPDLETAWYQLGVARQVQGNVDGALAAVDTALARKADFVEAKLLWIELSATKEPERCREAVDLLLRRPDAARLRRPLVPLLVTLRMYDQAAEALQALRSEAPRDVDLLQLQARCLIESGKPSAAAAALEELLTIEPRDPPSLASLARLYEVSGAHDKVLPTLERLLAVNPSNLAVRQRVVELRTAIAPQSPELEEHHRLLRHYRSVGREGGAKAGGNARPEPRQPRSRAGGQ